MYFLTYLHKINDHSFMQAIMLKKIVIWESFNYAELFSELSAKQLIFIHSFPIFQHKDACFAFTIYCI